MNRCTRGWILAFALLALTLTSTVATASGGPVLPPEAHPYGRTYSEWAAAWWIWALSQPASTNPNLDPTGAFCANEQEGKVWFLATTPGETVTRSCTVPLGTALLIPIINFLACGGTEDDIRSELSFVPRDANGLNATIDGIPVSDIQGRYFEESALFAVTLPDDNLVGEPPGTVLDPCADAGYYLMVHPLSPGEHTIEFSGSVGVSFSVAVTYHITVSM